MALFGKPNTQAVVKYSQLQTNTSMLDIPITIMWGQRRMSANCVWVNDFQKHKQNAKGKGGGKSTQYTYTAAVILALGEGPFDECLNVWTQGSTSTAESLSAAGYDLEPGSASQAPESYVTTKHPTEALAYAYTGYVFNSNENLGSAATVPNDAFEMRRLNGFTDTLTADGWKNPVTSAITAGVDVSMADIIPDLLTSAQYGIDFSFGDFADLTAFREYQDGQGFYFSPKLDSQEKATSVLDRWAKLCNSWIYWDGTLLRCLPLGDSAVGSFTPDLTPAYDLSVAAGDILDGTITVSRKDPADRQNRMVLEFADRTRGYVSNPAEYKDQTLVDLFGLRDGSSTQANEICNPTVAAVAVQLIGKRKAYTPKTYKWKSPARRIRLIPGSIVTLTEPNQDLDHELVRIQSVDNDAKGSLSFIAEELTIGVGTYEVVTVQGNGPQNNPAFNNDPGNINTPAVVEPVSTLTNGVPSVLISASGGVHWGGGNVYISFDNGASYNHIGDITSPAPQGLLTANLASYGGSNPDTGHTLSVDATQSLTPPATVSHADAQAGRSLSLVSAQPSLVGGFEVLPNSGELLAFGNVAATSTYAADLTYLERGLYGTTAGAHSTGDQFSVLDVSRTKGCTLFYPLPAQYIGQTLCLKIASFNTFGQVTQDLSVVTAYKYTPTGAGFGGGTAGVPTTPTGLTATPGIGQNVIAWTANPATDNVTAYKVYRAAGTGASFGSAALVATILATTWTDPGRTAGAGYTYFLVATNAAGDSGHTSGVNCTTGATVVGALRPNGGTPGRKPNAGEELFNITAALGDVLRWDGAGGFKKAFLKIENSGGGGVAPTSTWTITLKVNGSTVATGTIGASGTSGTFAGLTGDVVFADGDTFSSHCISPQDATAQGISIVIFGERTQ